MFRRAHSDGPAWGRQKLSTLALETRYKDTPVETVRLKDINGICRFLDSNGQWAGKEC